MFSLSTRRGQVIFIGDYFELVVKSETHKLNTVYVQTLSLLILKEPFKSTDLHAAKQFTNITTQ